MAAKLGDQVMLKAGVSKQIVTPPTWVPYLTSSGNGTCAPFEGVHDDLYARALVLDDGDRAICVLAVDAIGYENSILGEGRDFTRELRERVIRETGMEDLMLCATHSHSTPETIGLTPFRELPGISEWLEGHLEVLVKVAVDAFSGRTSARAFSRICRVEGVARNRRILLKDGTLDRRGEPPLTGKANGAWPVDEDLFVLYLERDSGEPLGVLLNYTAHPVVAMLLPPVSADYPGVTASRVERALPGAICLFTNGACGNVNSLHVSTNFNDVEKLGGILADAALREISDLKPEEACHRYNVSSSRKSVAFSSRPCPGLAEAREAVREADTPVNQRLLRLAKKLSEGSLSGEIQLMRLGDLCWMALPGEVFVETGVRLKKSGLDFVAGNANGWLGYFPTLNAYNEGGYEVTAGVWSRVAPGSAEQLEEMCRQLVFSDV
jgi:neutral ceramidase